MERMCVGLSRTANSPGTYEAESNTCISACGDRKRAADTATGDERQTNVLYAAGFSVRHVARWSAFPLARSLRSIDSADESSSLFTDFIATTKRSDCYASFMIGYDSSVFPIRTADWR